MVVVNSKVGQFILGSFLFEHWVGHAVSNLFRIELFDDWLFVSARLLHKSPLLSVSEVLTHLVCQWSLLKTVTKFDAKLQALSEVQHFNILENFVRLIGHDTQPN